MSQELKKEIYTHLIISLALFVLIEILWLISNRFSFFAAGQMFAGIILGSFILDADHLLYWFFLYPDLEEAKQAKEYWRRKKWRQLVSFLAKTHQDHTSLIFHHFIFQAVLLVLTIFILTSTLNVFARGLILAANLHLLIDQWADWRRDPEQLQKWLFARTPLSKAPLPKQWLRNYLIVYSVLLGGLIYAARY